MGATETNRRFVVFEERGKFPLLPSTPTAKAVMVQVGGVPGRGHDERDFEPGAESHQRGSGHNTLSYSVSGEIPVKACSTLLAGGASDLARDGTGSGHSRKAPENGAL
jgi:hypothetical protein